MASHLILPGFVDDAVDALTRKGVDPGPLLRRAGIAAVRDEPVTAEQYGALWRGATEALDDEFFGLGGHPMRAGSLELLCHAILHAGSLEQALRRALDFLRLVLDDPAGRLVVSDGLAQIVLTRAPMAHPAFAYRTYWLILHGVCCWLVGRRIPIRQVDFDCLAPPNREDYRDFFGAPVRFDQPRTRLLYAASHLDLAPIRSQAALRSFLRAAPANLLVRYSHDGGLALRIRTMLRNEPFGDWPRFETMARRLNMSPATLRRQLREEGQSFLSIKDELRNARAQALLREGALSVAEVAAETGYAETSAFYRAFVKWTGHSPGEFRET
ncbi:AraC family transcriptional regulator [Oceanicola sp. 22II-s10i]|uniref:AraC family transcriptional regulator n=1 Tax=Oceanicola sp. 22II-s10i TaxID=1317116 RepID=UPI000B523FC0|nr:AraC family transcriptional regulator [Oceanicola sp. 22II-s10i]OWU83787.1 AraC family transcriptional regulator [Oceanicola sp. 22II-s10i]